MVKTALRHFGLSVASSFSNQISYSPLSPAFSTLFLIPPDLFIKPLKNLNSLLNTSPSSLHRTLPHHRHHKFLLNPAHLSVLGITYHQLILISNALFLSLLTQPFQKCYHIGDRDIHFTTSPTSHNSNQSFISSLTCFHEATLSVLKVHPANFFLLSPLLHFHHQHLTCFPNNKNIELTPLGHKIVHFLSLHSSAVISTHSHTNIFATCTTPNLLPCFCHTWI